MDTKGQISILLARNKANGKPITRIEHLANATGISRHTLDAYDAGTQYVKLEHLHKIGRILELDSLGPLLGIDNQPPLQVELPDRIIKAAADEKDLTMVAVSRATGMRRDSLYNLDAGRAKVVQLTHLEKLCQVLDVNINYLLRYQADRQEATV